MTTGYVDENWAKLHHDLWYDEVARGDTPSRASSADRAAAPEPSIPASPDKA